MNMKTVRPSKLYPGIHIETPLAIINIYTDLTDAYGQRVERVEVIPNNYAGEPKVETDENIRSFRIIEQTKS